MLTLKDVSFAYKDKFILEGFDLDVRAGEIMCLLGASGSGKSTALRLAAGLESGEGQISCGDRPAVVFQDAALLPWETVGRNVDLPLRLGGQDDPGAVTRALSLVGLDGYEKRYPPTLSGGQRMRVAIARAIIDERKVLLMDEPFAAIDEIRRMALNDLVLDLRDDRDLTVLFVTHSLYEAAYLADKIAVINQGRVETVLETGWAPSARGTLRRGDPKFMDIVNQISRALGAADQKAGI